MRPWETQIKVKWQIVLQNMNKQHLTIWLSQGRNDKFWNIIFKFPAFFESSMKINLKIKVIITDKWPSLSLTIFVWMIFCRWHILGDIPVYRLKRSPCVYWSNLNVKVEKIQNLGFGEQNKKKSYEKIRYMPLKDENESSWIVTIECK